MNIAPVQCAACNRWIAPLFAKKRPSTFDPESPKVWFCSDECMGGAHIEHMLIADQNRKYPHHKEESR